MGQKDEETDLVCEVAEFVLIACSERDDLALEPGVFDFDAIDQWQLVDDFEHLSQSQLST